MRVPLLTAVQSCHRRRRRLILGGVEAVNGEAVQQTLVTAAAGLVGEATAGMTRVAALGVNLESPSNAHRSTNAAVFTENHQEWSQNKEKRSAKQ